MIEQIDWNEVGALVAMTSLASAVLGAIGHRVAVERQTRNQAKRAWRRATEALHKAEEVERELEKLKEKA